jgi:hypothetical protein
MSVSDFHEPKIDPTLGGKLKELQDTHTHIYIYWMEVGNRVLGSNVLFYAGGDPEWEAQLKPKFFLIFIE